ncbi:hypothetical protein B0H19DRAFT_577817 [Mycena capillaripes]|nr:hypothetical protein B0H19DRAFT_577817 [Mycena capillaripes]
MVRRDPKYFYFSFMPLVSSNAALLLIFPIFSGASFSLESIASTLLFLTTSLCPPKHGPHFLSSRYKPLLFGCPQLSYFTLLRTR